jgi:hypothetical protein
VGDGSWDLLGVAGHQGQCIHGATAGGEDLHRSSIQRRDQPAQVVRMLIGVDSVA